MLFWSSPGDCAVRTQTNATKHYFKLGGVVLSSKPRHVSRCRRAIIFRLAGPPQLAASFISDQACYVAFCVGFRMPACRDFPHAPTAGVRKAPRHEVAGGRAPTVQRALWGFSRGR